jgi:hypothetical protein
MAFFDVGAKIFFNTTDEKAFRRRAKAGSKVVRKNGELIGSEA